MTKGKKCVGCGKTHYNYGGTEYLFPNGIMISMTCNLCNADNGLWAVPNNGTAKRIG